MDYYRCDCGHVWTVSKNSDHERHDVTVSDNRQEVDGVAPAPLIVN